MPPIETHLHYGPLGSMIVVFGVDLALPLLMALGFFLRGLRGERDDRRTYFALARGAIIICVCMQPLCASYYARLFAGTVETGTVTHKEEFGNSRNPFCELTLQTVHGELELDVHQGYCGHGLELGAGVPVITIAGSTRFAQVGERATANVGLVLGVAPLMLLGLLWWLVRTPKRREH